MIKCIDYFKNEYNQLIEIWNDTTNGKIMIFIDGRLIAEKNETEEMMKEIEELLK